MPPQKAAGCALGRERWRSPALGSHHSQCEISPFSAFLSLLTPARSSLLKGRQGNASPTGAQEGTCLRPVSVPLTRSQLTFAQGPGLPPVFRGRWLELLRLSASPSDAGALRGGRCSLLGEPPGLQAEPCSPSSARPIQQALPEGTPEAAERRGGPR